MGVAKLPWNHPVVVRRFLNFCEPCPTCECVLFTGTVTNGWGRFVAHGFPGCPSGRTQAHRYSYAIQRAPIPEGFQIHHDHSACNHRRCVNAYHTEPISPEDHGALSNAYKDGGAEPKPDAAEWYIGESFEDF